MNTTTKTNFKAFSKTAPGKALAILVPVMLAFLILIATLIANPRAISISYDEGAYDTYDAKRNKGYSFYTTDSGSFCTTHGINPDDIQVEYLFAPSEDLFEAFENGNITIKDLDRLGFEYWFYANGK